MKFLYEYRTSGNEPRQGEIRAADRDAAFAALKARGIRPSAVREAPGFFNWLFGKGKRWIAIGALACAVCVLLAFWASVREEIEVGAAFGNTTRRQVIGDAAVVQKGILDGWSDVFPEEGERFLAGFAVPGVPVSVRNTTEREIREALGRKVPVTKDDSLEARQIKAMVEGMKEELREFLADGGSIVGYGQCLVQRQEQEIGYYTRAKTELDALVEAKAPREEVVALWEKSNDKLRRMGIRLLSLPEDESAP